MAEVKHDAVAALKAAVDSLPTHEISGRVVGVRGLMMECTGIAHLLAVGSQCFVEGREGDVRCEVVGFKDDRALLMPFGDTAGVSQQAKVKLAPDASRIYPHESWLGRVVNALGEPLDGKGPLPRGPRPYSYTQSAPPAHSRQRVGGKLDLGVRALNTFLTCCEGQRMGIFAGSGVGKSILMSMLARYAVADVNVIGLVGERSREVKEFIEEDLGEEGLARSVVVVATSSDSPLMRRQAAYLTMSIAEYFRDERKKVLCMMDSVTRFAMAQREIGLSSGEPPTSKGYTPTVFFELPKLLERAGPGGPNQGSITGLFTVLVEGDDTNEPVSDAVRGILDGHIVMERGIAQRGRYPAINILKSVSRTMPDCNSDQENELVQAARKLLATYADMEEMIRLGAYRQGADPNVDLAIQFNAPLEAFLSQKKREHTALDEGYEQLAKILGIEQWPPQPADEEPQS